MIRVVRHPHGGQPGGLWAIPNRTDVATRRAAVCRAAGVEPEALFGAPPPSDDKGNGGGGGGRRATLPMAPGVTAAPRFGHKHYPLALAWLDSGVAEVLDALRVAGLGASTLTIFTSDHAA